MKIYFQALIIGCFSFCPCVVNSVTAASISFEDGRYHIVNDTQYQDDFISLDSNIVKNPGTHLELVNGGSIREVTAKHNSLVTINGGSIVSRLYLHDKSTATINNGLLGGVWTGYESSLQISGGTITSDIESMGKAMVSIYGGVIEGKVEAWNDCTTDIYGGSIGKQLLVIQNGMIYLHGSEFMVGNHILNYGDSLRNYGTFNGNSISGTITGTLKDGSSLNNIFSIYPAGTANIIIIPEPATLCLLGLGGLLIRRKK